jgi:hypothetical protein
MERAALLVDQAEITLAVLRASALRDRRDFKGAYEVVAAAATAAVVAARDVAQAPANVAVSYGADGEAPAFVRSSRIAAWCLRHWSG